MLSPTPDAALDFIPARSVFRQFCARLALVPLVLLASILPASAEPLRLHPENPHYLLFAGQPTVLITSAEHYGAVLNLDFDYRPYLQELQSHGLNLTRTFSGAYCEPPNAFNITGNTLAPKEGRLICPWARSSTPGYANGGNKFDLEQWDPEYFARLKDFLAEADTRGVVVELVMFCPFYKDDMWELSPMKASNNVNGIGEMVRTDVYTLKHPELLAVQEAMVRKIVRELNEFENLYFEVCNEPYFGGVTDDWQDHIIEVIVATEQDLPRKHLIARNIANGSQEITEPHPAVSIFNFHYAKPPTAVRVNYDLNRVIADDETGFAGSEDVTYRREGWEFILAGGGIYSNLDYSFTPEHEDGTAKPQAPGGGGEKLRKQLGILKKFVQGFDFVRMQPDDEVIVGGVPDGARAWALSEVGRAYAIYVNAGEQADLALQLPAGQYVAQWLNTQSGKVDKQEPFRHEGGERVLQSPRYEEDIALSVKAASPE